MAPQSLWTVPTWSYRVSVEGLEFFLIWASSIKGRTIRAQNTIILTLKNICRIRLLGSTLHLACSSILGLGFLGVQGLVVQGLGVQGLGVQGLGV